MFKAKSAALSPHGSLNRHRKLRESGEGKSDGALSIAHVPTDLNTLHNHGSFAIQFIRVSFVTLLFTVLQSAAFMVFQHTMLAAVVAVAETAVAYYALRWLFAILVRATNFSRRHAATEGKGDVDGRRGRDVERGEGG